MSNYQFNTGDRSNLDATLSPSYYQFLETIVQRAGTILLDVDTASKGLAFDELVKKLLPFLRKYGKKLTFPQVGMVELREQLNSFDTKTKEKARRTLDGLNALASVGFVTFRGSVTPGVDAGEFILRYVSEHVFDEDILILTQDPDLARDCLTFEKFESIHMNHKAIVKRLSEQNGRLNDFRFTEDTPPASAATNAGEILKKRFNL